MGLRTQWRMAHFFAAFLPVDRTVLDNNNIRQTGQNREYSIDGLNRHEKLRYSWAVDLGRFKPGR